MPDELDRRLVGLLLDDARLPVRHLARSLGISEQSARQHLDRLRSNGTARVVALVDPATLDRPVIAFLTLEVIGDPDGAADALAALENLQWVATTADLTTVLGQASVASNEALLDLVNDSIRKIPGVRAVFADIGLRAFATSFHFGNLVGEGEGPTPFPAPWTGSDSSRRILDALDKAMLRALQRDGRATLTSLAHLTGLSVPATRQRFRRLLQEKLVRIQCIPDPAQFGLSSLGMVRIAVHADSAEVARHLSQMAAVTYIIEVAGGCNLHADLVARTPSELAGAFADIARAPGVGSAQLAVYRDVVKWMARWS